MKIQPKKPFKGLLTASLMGVLALGALAAPASAQSQEYTHACLTNANTSCPNVTVPRRADVEYQMDARTKVRKVLLYDNNAAHPAGKQAIRRALIRAANKYGFELVISDAAIGYITPTTLEGVDVVVFSQGDRDVTGSVGSAGDIALQNYIYRDGGAMLMMHAASAFITCPGTGTGGGGHNIADPSCRFMARAVARQYYHHLSAGSPARIYVDSVQAGQIPPHQSTASNAPPTPSVAVMPHGKYNDETKNIFDNAVKYNWPLPPNTTSDPRTFVWDNLADEWYTYFNNPGPRAIPAMQRTFNGEVYTEGRLNILLSLDETSRSMSNQLAMGDHPVSWVRKMGNGLAAYNNIGHDNTPYANQRSGSGLGVDSMAHAYLWNLVRFLARDYQGCMIDNDENYVPWATVESITPTDTAGGANTCSGTSIAIGPGQTSAAGVSAFANGIRVATPDAGFYQVYVTKLNGQRIGSRTLLGGHGKTVEMNELGKGTFIVQVTNPQKKVSFSRVVL